MVREPAEFPGFGQCIAHEPWGLGGIGGEAELSDEVHRQQRIARALLEAVRLRGEQWGCRRLYLPSEPDYESALLAWTGPGLSNLAGDYSIGGIAVTRDFKGPGRDRAVFELLLPRPLAEPEADR